MLKPLQIAHLSFPNNLIQGPLAGISTAPFRRLIWQLSAPAFSYTEMISCKTIIFQREFSKNRFLKIHPHEGPVCFQLSANNKIELAEASKIVTDLGATLIDLNCGCPVKKIRQKQAGSAHLANPSHLFQLIQAMKTNTHLPIGIKIRVDGESGDGFNPAMLKMLAESGLDFLTVHGRHYSENYETPCRYDEIQFFVQQLNVPVIGNGDIVCPLTLEKMFATGSEGAMIARASVGQPWLIAGLKAACEQKSYSLPHLAQIGAFFIEHIEELKSLLGNEAHALLHARKLGKYYARGVALKHDFCLLLNTCQDLNSFRKLCQAFFI